MHCYTLYIFGPFFNVSKQSACETGAKLECFKERRPLITGKNGINKLRKKNKKTKRRRYEVEEDNKRRRKEVVLLLLLFHRLFCLVLFLSFCHLIGRFFYRFRLLLISYYISYPLIIKFNKERIIYLNCIIFFTRLCSFF